jgi:phenylpropionate dioxygenase-like ring-hydroxylating dioxygenase large terminal subunit
MAFVLNAWYVAAWPHEVPPGTLLARTICNEAIVLWRGADGKVTALEDRCPHRELPLSMGVLEERGVRCRYHGLRFTVDGRCDEIPGQAKVTSNLDVRHYPTVEKYGWIWLWPGEPARARPELVPDLYAHNDLPQAPMEGGVAHFAANYLLLTDNLLDLTHEPYIHPTTLGNQAVFESPAETTVDGDRVTVERWMLNRTPSDYWAAMLKDHIGYEGACDRWQRIFYAPPCNIWLDVGVAVTGSGAPQGDRSKGVWQISNHAITPETETSLFDFWSIASQLYDRKRAREVADIVQKTILQEDREAVEGVQRVIDRHPGRPYASIATDKPGLAVRRIVDRLLDTEAATLSRAG